MDLISTLTTTTSKGGTPSPSNIELVGVTSSGFSGTTADRTLSLTSLTGGLATAPAEDDLVLIIYAACTLGRMSVVTSGYTEITFLQSDDTNDTNMVAAYKFMGATPDTQVVVTGSGASVAASVACVQVWRNVNQSDTFPLVNTNTEINTARPTPPSIDPPSGAFHIIVGAASGNQISTPGQAYVDPLQYDTWTAAVGNDTVDCTGGVGAIEWTGGTFTPNRILTVGSDSGNYSCVSFSAIMRST